MDVKTIDLYAVGERSYDRQPDGVHYDDEGYDRLAAAVSEAVLTALRERQKRRAAATAPASASP